MDRKEKTHKTVKCSQGMTDLLLDPQNTVTIAKAYDVIEMILRQAQRDVSKGTDDDKCLSVIRGIEHLDDQVLLLFREEGKLDLEAAEAANKKTP